MKIKFYPRYKTNKYGLKPLYAVVSFQKKRFEISTQIKINPEEWNSVQQKFNKPKENIDFQNKIDIIRGDLSKIYSDLLRESDNIELSVLKHKIKDYFNPSIKSNSNNFHKAFEDYILRNKRVNSRGTYKKIEWFYNKYILEYEKLYLKNKRLDFAMIDNKFAEKFLAFLIESGLNNNSALNRISIIKSFMNWALVNDYHSESGYLKINKASLGVKEYETEDFALNLDEVKRLIRLETLQPYLDRCRDVFLFQIFTGQRYSDVKDIQKSDIQNGVWSFIQKKTKNRVDVPLLPVAQQILDKYANNDKPLPVISNQKMNIYLKELGKLINLNDPFKKISYRGKEIETIVKPKYEFLHTHTARKTFSTISRQLGIRPELVKKFTGHKSDKQFDIYNKISMLDLQKEVVNKWNEKL